MDELCLGVVCPGLGGRPDDLQPKHSFNFGLGRQVISSSKFWAPNAQELEEEDHDQLKGILFDESSRCPSRKAYYETTHQEFSFTGLALTSRPTTTNRHAIPR